MNEISLIHLDNIVKNRFQPEGVRNEATVLEIAASLKQNEHNGTKGLLQVPTARIIENGKVELAFGHHRYDAFYYLAHDKGDLFFDTMPLIMRELSDIEMFEMMAIENFHRRDIGPMEEARTLYAYMTNFDKNSVETATKFEKTEEYVRGMIRLLNLPEPAQKMMETGRINKSQARDLLVAEKLGGAELVQEIIYEIETDSETASPTKTIDEVIRMSDKTTSLDTSADWFSSKKFPVKHLPKLTKTDLVEMIHYDESYSVGQPTKLIDEIMTLISSGMEVTDETFPMITPESLARLCVMVNPPQCEKCPFHAVLGGQHFCGLPQCKTAKIKAWEGKKIENEVKEIGIPLYQKSDGAFVQLDPHNSGDTKLFDSGDTGLRLVHAQYIWNNFLKIPQHFKVVLVGEKAEARLKRQVANVNKAEQQRGNLQKEQDIKELKRKFLTRFEWEVVSLAFQGMLDGITNFDFMEFFRAECIDLWADDNDFPDDMNEGELILTAEKAKKSDGLNAMRRILMFHIAKMGHTRECDFNEVVAAKKSIIKYAADFEIIAKDWNVTLPKDFSKQAEAYQAELDAAIKGLGKS